MDSVVRLIVGLGNPTDQYRLTRHNIGREFIDYLSSSNKSQYVKTEAAEICQLPSMIGAKVRCFMNESGIPLRRLMQKEGIEPAQILVVVDDFMIPFGTLRLRPSGSAGGHNGLKSIIEHLQTEEFPRMRVGVGPVPLNIDPAEFVLEKFSRQEQDQMPRLFTALDKSVQTLMSLGIQKAMNESNKNHL